MYYLIPAMPNSDLYGNLVASSVHDFLKTFDFVGDNVGDKILQHIE